MSEAIRTHYEYVTSRVAFATYSDGDVVISVDGDGCVLLESPQVRELVKALGELPEGGVIDTRFGRTRFGDMPRVAGKESSVRLYDNYPTESVTLSASDAIALRQGLTELGF